jgi:uncharacterized phage protein (TIGR02218 family)
MHEVGGMVELNDTYQTLTVLTPTTFEISTDTSAFTDFTSGGEARITYGHTNIDHDIDVDGITYRAAEGSVPSTFRTNTNGVVNDVEMLNSYVTQLTVAESDIHAGKLDYAEAECFLVNYKSIADGKLILLTGHTGETKLHRSHYVNAISSLSTKLASDTLEVVTPDCRLDLGDSKCGVDTAALSVTGTVTAVTSKKDFDDTSRTEGLNYFDGGLLTWTSGDNVGTAIEVKQFEVDNFILFESTNYDIQIGDTYSVFPGCDKIKATCISKFDNILNFNGFDFLPGPNTLSKVGNPYGSE